MDTKYENGYIIDVEDQQKIDNTQTICTIYLSDFFGFFAGGSLVARGLNKSDL